MGTNGDMLEIEDENLLADPSVIPNCQFPRKVDVSPWFDHNSIPDLGAKPTKHATFQR